MMSTNVFEPLSLGPAALPNRLVLAPVKTALGGPDGQVTDRHIAYYRKRAEGGVGLLILEPCFVDSAGREHPKQLAAHENGVIPGWRRLIEAIHAEGALVFAHLNHAGRAANPKVVGEALEAPSAVACDTTGAVPRPMSPERILEVLDAYAGAAARAREAGFDGVELQLGLGYLPAQFLSARTNQRTDEWGAEAGRWRFIDEVVARVREAIGPDLALCTRFSAEEKVDGGLGLEDAVQLGLRVKDAGVDALHVVTGSACDSPPWYYQHMALPGGVNEDLAAIIRDQVALPVLVAGRLGRPEVIRDIVESGQADAVALGRALVADPELPSKMREGREGEIMYCGACLQGCLAQVKSGKPIGCIINPEVGREVELPGTSLGEGRSLVVIGGGPGGLQAALTAHRAGFQVTLFEAKEALGGLFTLAGLTTGKETMTRTCQSLVRAVLSSGIEVRTDVEATADLVLSLEAQRVIVATGSRPVEPPIPGLTDPLTAEEVLTGRRETGPRVLVLGGGLVGIELAEHLAVQGREVVVVELLEEVARDMEAISRKMTMKRLSSLPVTVLQRTRLLGIENGEAIVRGEGNEEERTLGRFDSVVTAVGHRSYDPLSASLRAAGLSVEVIGDAEQPGQVLDATRAGWEVITGSGE